MRFIAKKNNAFRPKERIRLHPLRWLLRFSSYHPRAVIGVASAITFAACLFIPRVELMLDARSLIPVNDSALAASDDAAKVFGLRDVAVIGVANKKSGIYTPDTLMRIARLTESLAAVDGVVAESITSLATVPRMFIEDGAINTCPLLSQAPSFDVETAGRLRRETEALGLNNGILVDRDERAAAIFAEVAPGADRYEVLGRVRELASKESGGEDSIHLSGTALAQAALGQSAARDLVRLIPLVIIVLAVILILSFGDVVPAAISITEISVSLLWTAGLMGLANQHVFVTTLVLPVILIAIGVSDDVYALNHYLKKTRGGLASTSREKTVAAFSGVIHPISITAISTVVGLLSLAATGLEPLRVLGFYGAIAITFSTVFSFSLVPALLVLKGSRVKSLSARKRDPKGMHLMLRMMMAAGPIRIVLLMAVAAVCAGLLTTRLRVDDNWVNNLPDASDIFQGDRTLNDLLAGTTTVDLMIDCGQSGGFLTPQLMTALGDAEDRLSALPFVGAVYSVYSDAVRINAALRGVSYSQYRESLRQGSLELSSEEIEQSLLLMASTRRLPLSERVDNKRQRARVTVFIRSADYDRIRSVLGTASALDLKTEGGTRVVTPFGDGWISYLTVHMLVEGQLRSIALALLVDLLLLSILLKSITASLTTILPIAFSVLVVFAVLAVTQTPLGIANSMFAGIALGIGLDFSIHLTSAYRRELFRGRSLSNSLKRAFIGTGPAIVTSALAISAGFSVLILSDAPPNAQLGLTICLSLLICAAATLFLVPSLVLSRKVTRRA